MADRISCAFRITIALLLAILVRHRSVTELLNVFRRRDIKWILDHVKTEDLDAFYIIEQAREVSCLQVPVYEEPTGWRAVLKRK